MRKVLLISTIDNENALLSFIPALKKTIYLDDIILCNSFNNSHMAFINEPLNLPAIHEQDPNYHVSFNQGIEVVQKKYSNENVIIFFLTQVNDLAITNIVKIAKLIEDEGYDMVCVEGESIKDKGKSLSNLLETFCKKNTFETSPLQGMKMRKLLQLNTLSFGKKWKNALISKAIKSEYFYLQI